MKANELRIGNLLNKDWVVVTIDARTIFDIWNDEGLKNYKPIPLTEEWLVRFGAEKYDFDNGQPNQYRIGNRLFVVRDNFIVDYGSSVIIKYVHRLQNLYFALTGEELTIS